MASFCPSAKWSWAGATTCGRPRWLSQAVTQAPPGLRSQPPLPLPSRGKAGQSCPAGPADSPPPQGTSSGGGGPSGLPVWCCTPFSLARHLQGCGSGALGGSWRPPGLQLRVQAGRGCGAARARPRSDPAPTLDPLRHYSQGRRSLAGTGTRPAETEPPPVDSTGCWAGWTEAPSGRASREGHLPLRRLLESELRTFSCRGGWSEFAERIWGWERPQAGTSALRPSAFRRRELGHREEPPMFRSQSTSGGVRCPLSPQGLSP